MGDHDPLCPVIATDCAQCPQCALIARVRADERATMEEVAYWIDRDRHFEAEVRERIAQEIEADHATGPLSKAFGGGARRHVICTHGRDATIARGKETT